MSWWRLEYLNPHPPYPPYLVSSFGLRHDPYKIDPHHIRVDFIFVRIHESSPLECSSLHHTECIEWVSMWLISTIAHLYKYKKIAISCDNIDLSSLDLIIPLEYLESLLTEISCCDIFSGISDGTTGRSSWSHSFHIDTECTFLKKYQKLLLPCFIFVSVSAQFLKSQKLDFVSNSLWFLTGIFADRF